MGAARPRGAVIASPSPMGELSEHLSETGPFRQLSPGQLSEHLSETGLFRQLLSGQVSEQAPEARLQQLLWPPAATGSPEHGAGRPAATRAAREGGETGETKEGKRAAWASPPCSGPPAEAGGTVGAGVGGLARAGQNLRVGA